MILFSTVLWYLAKLAKPYTQFSPCETGQMDEKPRAQPVRLSNQKHDLHLALAKKVMEL